MKEIKLKVIMLLIMINLSFSQNPIDNCTKLPNHIPKDINDLAPQNVDVIMTLGDSITAAFGVMGREGKLNEFRGQSCLIGGDEGAITLSNFIKHYNPKVFGSSIGTHFVELPGTPHWEGDFLNSAQSGATTFDFTSQIAYLVNELNSNPNIDMENDYKLLSFIIGANDVCNSCWSFDRPTPEQAAQIYADNIELSLEKIYESIPRTLVNILPLFNLSGVYNLSLGVEYCKYVHDIFPFECNCAFDSNDENRLWLDTTVTLMGKKLFEIAHSWQSNNLPGFNVVCQPFSYNIDIANFSIDFLSNLDCFHPSLLAHQKIAIATWNSLIVPLDQKPTTFDPSTPLKCADSNSRLFTS